MTLESDHLQSPVDCFLLEEGAADALKSRGIFTLEQAVQAYKTDPYNISKCGADLPCLIELFISCTIERNVDWNRYWQFHPFKFDIICVSLPALDRLSSEARTLTVDRSTLGLTGRALANSGYSKLGPLVDAMKSGVFVPSGVGHYKLKEFFGMLASLADRVQPDGSISGFQPSHHYDVVIPDHIASLPIDVLHIGPKSKLLIKSGFNTIGEMASAKRSEIYSIRSIGRTTIDIAFNSINYLLESSENNSVNWSKYCSLLNLPLIPRNEFSDGLSFVTGIGQTMLEFSANLDDLMLRDIIETRLIQHPSDQSTLEEIAKRHKPVITRQRVQQKEDKLLRQIAGALIWGEDHGLKAHFHPQFRQWWADAASEFVGSEDITVDHFIIRLAAVWGVDIETLIPQLPIILAIVTGEPQMSVAYRNILRVHPRLFKLAPETYNLPIQQLRFGKRTDYLEERQLLCLGDVVEVAKNGHLPSDVFNDLNQLASCISNENLCLKKYKEMIKIDTIPFQFLDQPDFFIETFNDTIVTILERIMPIQRYSQIFLNRTSIYSEDRPTLEKIGIQFSTFGSSIKREETILLETLNQILIGEQHGRLPFWIDNRWLSWFQRSYEAYRITQPDYDAFLAELTKQLGAQTKLIMAAAPALWAIANGYPIGRTSRKRSSVNQYMDGELTHEPMRIKLLGFRRVH